MSSPDGAFCRPSSLLTVAASAMAVALSSDSTDSLKPRWGAAATFSAPVTPSLL